MQTRKTKKADLEQQRGTFFLFGLILSLSAVLLAFNWNTEVSTYRLDGTVSFSTDDDFYIPPIVVKEKKPEPPALKKAVNFELVDNNTEIDEKIDFFVSDVTNDDVFNIDQIVRNQPKEKPEEVSEVFNWVDEMPEFPGGEPALLSFLNKSVKYPVIAQENGIQGKVYVSFVIETNGIVSNVIVTRGSDLALNNEALRVVQSMPKWKPGKQHGRNVRVSYTVPINFVLQ